MLNSQDSFHEQEISFSPALLPSSSLCLLSSNTRAGKRESTMGLKDRKKSLSAELETTFGCPELVFVEFFLLYQLFSFKFYFPGFYLSSLLSGAWTEIENYSKPDL